MDAHAPHECSSGCKACRELVRSSFQLIFLSSLFKCFKIEKLCAREAEINLLRLRIAELENTSDAGDEPMQIDADDDNVVILEAFSPVTAAVSNIAAAKKVRCSMQIFVLASRIHLFAETQMWTVWKRI